MAKAEEIVISVGLIQAENLEAEFEGTRTAEEQTLRSTILVDGTVTEFRLRMAVDGITLSVYNPITEKWASMNLREVTG